MNRTIVIIHPGALGDILVAVPAIRRLRIRFPQHQLILCANDQASELLAECRVIDRWLSVQGMACVELFGGSIAVTSELSQWLARCDFAIAWVKDEEGALAATLRTCVAGEVRVVSPFSHALRANHQSDRFLETLVEPPTDPSMPVRLQLLDRLIERGRSCLQDAGVQIDRPLVVFHPGSGSLHKCVKPEILARAIEGLQNEDAVPILLEGPADQQIVANLLRHIRTEPVVLRGLALGTLAGILTDVRLFVGHDSGITHLSALLGVRTVALVGPTDPERWAPRGRHVSILRGAPCSCLDWQAVSNCAEKSCLRLSIEEILTICRTQLGMAQTPEKAHSAPCL